MSRILIAGNWKMNMNTSQASILLHRLQERIKIHRDVEVVLFPSMLTLQPLSVQLDRRKFRLGAQDAHFQDDGPFTGEVSISMLRDLVHYVIIGHSDRRYKFNESEDSISKKVAACFRNDITPLLCVGETNQEKLAGETNQVLHDQLTSALAHITSPEAAQIVIAYEPVWALSDGHNFTGHVTPKPDEVEKAAATIRKNVEALFGPRIAKKVRVLYGGSVNADNTRSYLEVPGINGLLVGGASLNYHQFSSIVDAAFRVSQSE